MSSFRLANDRSRATELAAMACCTLLAGLFAWLLVRLVWAVLPASADVRVDTPPRDATSAGDLARKQSVAKWHLFGNTPLPASGPSTTSLILRGTLADADPTAGIAVIADAGKGERSWRVGEDVSPGVRLVRVYADHVVVTRDGQEETLPLPRDTTAAPAPSARAASGRASRAGTPSANAAAQNVRAAKNLQDEVERLRQNPTELARRVQVVPVLADGHLAGVRVSTGTDTALLNQLGFQQGDVVTAVNGMPVDSIERGQQIMSTFGSAASVRVTVLRAGKPTEITVGLR